MNDINIDKNHIQGAITRTLKYAIEYCSGSNEAARRKLILSFAEFTILIVSKVLPVLFRKNLIISVVDLVKLIICSLAFMVVGGYSISLTNDFEKLIGVIHYSTGVLFTLLGFHMLLKSISYFKIRNKPVLQFTNQGTSTLLKFLIKKERDKNIVQHLAEPLLILTLGFFISSFNLVPGIALMVCAASYWLNMLRMKIFGNKSLQQKATHMNSQLNPNKTIHKVKP